MRMKALYRRYSEAIVGEPLPLAMIDLDSVDRNVAALLGPIERSQKTLRIASKSIRSVEMLRYLLARGKDRIRGLMCFSPREAHYLVEQGFDDILIAYPTMQWNDALLVAEANARGAHVSLAVDAAAHLQLAERAAIQVGSTIPVIVDIDVAYRPLGERLSVGVLRSPLHEPERIADFVESISGYRHLGFAGLLAYEAHIAGVADQSRSSALESAAVRAMKRLAKADVSRLRKDICAAITRRGIAIPLFNGGGSGSVGSSASDDSLTEIAAGSGFLDSHLFDGYDGLDLSPAAFFALPVTRIPKRGFATCQSGGFIASGAPGRDRLPIPHLPEGLRLIDLEGAGEVQTPLRVSDDTTIAMGDPVFFRHAKAGELAEHFLEYLLVRDRAVESRVKTYRGAGQLFF